MNPSDVSIEDEKTEDAESQICLPIRKSQSSIFCRVKNAKIQRPLVILFNRDNFEQKIDLKTVSYKEPDGNIWTLSVVDSAKKIISKDETSDKEFLSPLGLPSFCNASINMLLGYDNPAIIERRSFGIQSLTGTGALRLAAEYLVKFNSCSTVYVSIYGKSFHTRVFSQAGVKKIKHYRYWDTRKMKFDCKLLIEDLRDAPLNAAIIFHSCGYDGCDPSKEEWYQIARFLKEKHVIPVFDCGSQGFATGDLDEDVWSVRYFIASGFELFCSQSIGRNFGMANECVGNLTVVANNSTKVVPMKIKFKSIILGMYYSPPMYGAKVISYILNNYDLCEEWINSFKVFSSRVHQTRTALRSAIECLGTPGDWSMLTDQKGFFTYTSLTRAQIIYLREKHHVYILPSGKFSMTGITPFNLEYIAHAFHDTFKKSPPIGYNFRSKYI